MRGLVITALVAAAPVAAAADVLVIDPGARFPEGPVVVGGVLHYVEYAGNRLMRWDGSGPPAELWRREGCGPSGTLHFAGGFLVACYDAGALVQVSASGATGAVVTADAAGAPLVGPNDLAADGAGGAWMTTSGPWASEPIAGKVYPLGPGLVPTLAADDLHYANGIVAAGAVLYVAESEAARIVAFDIAPDFTLANRRLFARIGKVDPESGPWAYPDGLRLGPDGNLWAGSYSRGRIVAIAPDGSLARAIDVPGATAPNLAFGPAGELYVVTVDETAAPPYAGRVLRVE